MLLVSKKPRQEQEPWLLQPCIDEVPRRSINKGKPASVPTTSIHSFIHSLSPFLFHNLRLQAPPLSTPDSSLQVYSLWLALYSLFAFLFPPSAAMESSSHITGDGGDEGCNSSESGWTIYLVSPLHGDDSGGSKGSGSEGSSVDDGYGYIMSDRRTRNAYEDEAEDDDSLASDASTGPAKVKVPSMPEDHNEDGGRGKSGDGEGGGGGGKEEQEDDDVRTKLSTSSRKKAGKVDRGGEGKSSRKGHGKRGSSSRTSFFFW